MIDVHQHDPTEADRAAGSQRRSRVYDEVEAQPFGSDEEDEDEEEDEAAWLESVQGDDLANVQGMQAGGLVLDVNQLRGEHSAAKKSLKANVGG